VPLGGHAPDELRVLLDVPLAEQEEGRRDLLVLQDVEQSCGVFARPGVEGQCDALGLAAVDAAAGEAGALRTVLGAVVSTFAQPVSAGVRAAAASSAAAARNPVPVFFIFLVREGMRGLYIASIDAVYSDLSNFGSR
jgi:hypothetical protein